MAVPDTNTFSLQDVCDQFTKNPPDDLGDCFSVILEIMEASVLVNFNR